MKTLNKNRSFLSECCSVPYSREEGRCRTCFENCIGAEVCNECGGDLVDCECEERCRDCETWATGACFTCKMD